MVVARLQSENTILVRIVVFYDESLKTEKWRHVVLLNALGTEHLARLVHKLYDLVELRRLSHLIAHRHILEQGADGIHGRLVSTGVSHYTLMQVVRANLHIGNTGVVPHIQRSLTDVASNNVVTLFLDGCNIYFTIIIIDVVIVVQAYQRSDVSLSLLLGTGKILPRDGEQTIVAATATQSLTNHLTT